MGKIFSPPKMPSAPPMIVYTPEPAPVAVAASPDEPPSGTGGSNPDAAPEVTPDEQRLKNILTRRRGRLGTIETSFNGVLKDMTTPARKSLLGE